MKRQFYLICLFMLFGSKYLAAQNQFLVYFDSNQFALNEAEKTRLTEWIRGHQTAKILALYGYTDEKGTAAANDTLAFRRVQQVYQQIQGKVAIRPDFKQRSFGETVKKYGKDAENRNVTIFFLNADELDKEKELIPENKIPETSPPPALLEAQDLPDVFTVDEPDGTERTYKLNREFMAQLANAKPDEKVVLSQLNFVVNTFAIVPESRRILFELLVVMQKKPGLKIGIEGHLCCAPTDRLDLSTQRAKAIYHFLTQQGISKNRITYKGLGTSQPIYPIPEKTDSERAANRRVEIRVVENQ